MSIKRMDRTLGYGIGVLVAIVPTMLIFLVGVILHSFDAGLYSATAWMGAYFAWNITIVDQQDWQCIERLGQFWDLKLNGIRLYCARGIIDRIEARGNLKERNTLIFQDAKTGGPEELDFANGSAPIEGYMWYKNGREGGTDAQIEEDIMRYVYASDDSEARVVQITEGRLRPKFQRLNFDAASETRIEVINGELEKIAEEMRGYGLYLAQDPPIVIADIELTEEQKKLRQERMRGLTEADRLAAEADGYRKAIEAIMYKKNADGTVTEICDFTTAKNIWEAQQTRDTVEKTGANVTIIGDSAGGIVKTLGLNEPTKK